MAAVAFQAVVFAPGRAACVEGGNKLPSRQDYGLGRPLRFMPRAPQPRHSSGRLHREESFVCMAVPKRVAMVSKQIEREIGQMLLTDQVLQNAVCPERKRGMDSYLSAIASVTEVELSRDLQVAKVYISVYSDEEGKALAFQGLSRLQGYIRKNIGQRIRLRMTPEIRLIPDESFDRSQRVLSLLKKIEDGTAEAPPVSFPEDELDFELSDEEDIIDSDVGSDSGGLSEEEIEMFIRNSPYASGSGKPSGKGGASRQQRGKSGKSNRRK
mmetsp:Transcript_19324/g.53872  ORF Transcript_19324/g.53872 Transcript_19324/m.53872 type:complete len:269 (-) Transcript_19324:254-1060(-)